MPEAVLPDLFPVPILLIVFNRPSLTRRVFKRIAEARPVRLLIVADGPRPDKPGEEELCREVRKIVSAVDWPCEVLTNFAPSNLGCRERIISGLNWTFSIVEEALIFEDDCLPDLSFFPFCRDILERYKDDFQIAAISGVNLVEEFMDTPYSYYFSQLGGNCGWATWRTRWTDYDEHLKNWPALRAAGALSKVFDRPRDIAYWTRKFDMVYEGGAPSAWDYQWFYTRLFGNKLVIVPSVNLIENIGYGPGATHTRISDLRLMPSAKSIKFPLRHPNDIIASHSLDLHHQDLYFQTLFHRIARVVNHLVHRAKNMTGHG
jgi:hypothetical protein